MALTQDIARLYDEHASAVFAFLANLLRDESDARDVMQELFIKLVRRPTLLDDVRDERGFLLRLGHNLAIDLMRRRGARDRRGAELDRDAFSLFAPTTDPDEQVFREKLAEALGELPADQRAVVHLKLWEQLTFDAIAQILEIPPNTAASRYRYGLDKLRDRLRPIYDEIK